MYCGHCGKESLAENRYCTACGYILDSNPAEAVAPAALSSLQPLAIPSEDHIQPIAADKETVPIEVNDSPTVDSKLKGVGGWLEWFCIKMTVFSALYGIYYASKSDTALGSGLVMVLSAFEIYVGIAVWSISRKAIRDLRVYFGISIFLALIYISLGFVIGTDDKDAVDLIQTGLKSLFSQLIWGLYFVYSKRVENTFGRRLLQRKQKEQPQH